MSVWEMRQILEEQMPWWSVLVTPAIALLAYGIYGLSKYFEENL
jgi:hypothetical protein